MARQPVVLEKLFQAAPAEQCSTNFLIFSLLVPFIHREGAIGQQARDSLLLVMAASASHDALAHYITENSYFCPVSEHASFAFGEDAIAHSEFGLPSTYCNTDCLLVICHHGRISDLQTDTEVLL